MPFGLLTPAFLIGFAALAVPLIIHLIRRERHDAVEFPSLMFLSRIPQRTVKRRRIRNWWLFALRCLALILLAGAFARPFIDRSDMDASLVDASREIVILVDRSYSMGYGDRWTRALAAARAAVDGMTPQDRASVIFFDATAHAATEPTAEPARLRSALDTARVGAGVTRYGPALKLAQSIVATTDRARSEVVIISDFQRAGWDGAAGAQLPTGAVVRPVHIGAGEATENLVVTGVTTERRRVGGLERVNATVHLANRGTRPASDVRVTLDVNGRTVQTSQANVPANGTSRVELQPLTLGEVAARATITAGSDALPGDNVFHLTLTPDPGLRVLVLEPGGNRDVSLYLRRALELAQDPPVTLNVRRDAIPASAELARTDVIVLNDVLPPDGAAGTRLVEWVEAGGGLVLALGDRTAAAWTATARQLAGGAPDRVVDRIDGGGGRIGYVDYSSEVFELFRSPRGGAFSSARFYRYRPVPISGAGDTTAAAPRVLARFDDGAAALIERRIGSGRVLVWTSTLDAYWSSLALEPMYLPLVHQLVRHAAGFAPPRPWNTAGQVVDVAGGAAVAQVVATPTGTRLDLGAGETLLPLDAQGFYEVHDARTPNTQPRLIAVNLDVTESDLTPLDPAELVSAVTVTGPTPSAAARISLPPEEQERRQALWWYLLVSVFALLTAEAVFANRRSRRAA